MSGVVMNKTKLFIGSSLMIAMLSTSAFPASADSLVTNDITQQQKPINLLSNEEIPGVKIIDITREQYVKNVAKNENISYKEADKLVSARTAQSLSKINPTAAASSNVVWRQASWTQTYSGNSSFKADLEGSFEIYSSGSFRQINSSTVGSSLSAGKYSATWAQSNSWKTTAYPTISVTLGVTGKFFTTVSNSGGVSGGIAGFSVSSTSTTSVTYVSNGMTIQREYSVY
ncbi:hypothetical protein [Bacillus mobilis]|uniref:hypothetical protein n=1 Tax=Bacillus mobilis TaxID=2026190 RepID=UPI0022E0D85D|nr:hypothetical protein [Bacillus mobilis]